MSASNPLAQPHTIQSVNNLGSLQADGSIAWSNRAALNAFIASGTVEPVSGISGLSVTLSNSANQPLEYGTQCPADNCSWAGNFAPGANLLWDGGTYQGNNWVGNGPMTLAFSSPQRGVGFQVMPDEYGTFTATVCAFDGSNTQLGCASFNASTDDPQAAFMGIYDDTQEISKVTVDAGGALYPHDFAIGDLYVVNGEKQLASVPASVTVPAGQTTATFPVTSNPVSQATSLTISGDYNGIQTATLTLTTPDLAFLIMNPASVPEGLPRPER